jgi:hypothetical protein
MVIRSNVLDDVGSKRGLGRSALGMYRVSRLTDDTLGIGAAPVSAALK